MLTRDHTVLLAANGMSNLAFTPQTQSITSLWSVLISRPAEGRRLSWPGWEIGIEVRLELIEMACY